MIQRKTRNLFLIAVGSLGFVLITAFVFLPELPDQGDFRNNLWAPAHLLLQSKSPYQISVLYPDSNSIWFPQIIGAGWFFGLLNFVDSGKIWAIINVLSLIYMIVINIPSRPKPSLLGLALMGIFLFPPITTHFLFGQSSIFLIALLLFSCNSASFFSPAALMIGLSKPQLGILFCLGFFYTLLRTERKFLGMYLAGLFLSTLVLLAPLFLLYPNWMPDFLSNINTNAHWDQPTILNILTNILDTNLAETIWQIILFLAIIFTLVIWNTFPPKKASVFSLAMTTIISPYLWSWDFVLVLPFVVTMVFDQSKLLRYVSMICLITCDVLVWLIRLSGPPVNDKYSWWIPPIIILPIMIAYFYKYPIKPPLWIKKHLLRKVS